MKNNNYSFAQCGNWPEAMGTFPSPPFSLHALWSCVSTHHKNNKPKSLPNNTWWKKTNNNQSNNLCYRHNYFGFVSFVSFLLHTSMPPTSWPCCQSCMMTTAWLANRASLIQLVQGKTICVVRRRSSLPTRLMWWCESMGSNNNGGSLNSHALEFRKCQHNMVGFFWMNVFSTLEWT